MTKPKRPILLLGASGFIGHAVLSWLFARGDHVVGLARRQRPNLLANPAIAWVYGDLRDPSLLGRLFSTPPDAVIYASGSHTPANSSRDPVGDLKSNLIPLVRCLEHAVNARVRRFVYISSGGTVYGPTSGPALEDAPNAPIGAYGLSKVTAERYIRLMTRNSALSPAILRVSNIYGPEQLPKPGFGFIPTAILHALRGESIPLFNEGRDIRDYVYVDDVVLAVLAALDGHRELTINIGSGVGSSGVDVVKALESVLGKPISTHFEGARGHDVTSIVLNIERARDVLGWRPTMPLQSGLVPTVDWLSQQL